VAGNFQLSPSGAFTTLHVFGERRTDTTFPSGDLIRDAAGNIYRTTCCGGAHQSGTVFKLDPSGFMTVQYHFNGAAEGIDRRVGVLDSAGNLYGTAFAGGDLTCDAMTTTEEKYCIQRLARFWCLDRNTGTAFMGAITSCQLLAPAANTVNEDLTEYSVTHCSFAYSALAWVRV
jgi:uncharacterized repeat protein (TIGR03803 family)